MSRPVRPQDPAPPFRCAAQARERGDPLIGSTPQARRWLLLESRRAWAVDAVAGSRIDPAVLELLTRTAQEQQARPLLVRRPGRPDPSRPLAWAVSYDSGVTRWGEWERDTDLLAAAEALALPAPDAAAVPGPVLLVCAHGLHDACCAIRGRPVAAALAEQWPDATWECSHVGGDRFAPNLVVLPDGVYYGALDPATAVDTVRTHLAGQVVVPHLRGIASVPPAAQAAFAAAYEQYGPLAAADVRLVDLQHPRPGLWLVEIEAAGAGRLHAQVAATRRDPARLTCRAGSAVPATEYRVLRLGRDR